jgi:glutathione peroxidase
MNVHDFSVVFPDGSSQALSHYAGSPLLLVNVASKCGFTPQYEGLEQLARTGAVQVIGFPCNQFGGQEPGSPEEIATFCSATYGVSFPLTEKIEVNGPGRHPLYAELTETPDATGAAGDVQWNFEKFLVAPDGAVTRFRPRTEPESEEIVAAVRKVVA